MQPVKLPFLLFFENLLGLLFCTDISKLQNVPSGTKAIESLIAPLFFLVSLFTFPTPSCVLLLLGIWLSLQNIVLHSVCDVNRLERFPFKPFEALKETARGPFIEFVFTFVSSFGVQMRSAVVYALIFPNL